MLAAVKVVPPVVVKLLHDLFAYGYPLLAVGDATPSNAHARLRSDQEDHADGAHDG